jgi:hypothetical protein
MLTEYGRNLTNEVVRTRNGNILLPFSAHFEATLPFRVCLGAKNCRRFSFRLFQQSFFEAFGYKTAVGAS